MDHHGDSSIAEPRGMAHTNSNRCPRHFECYRDVTPIRKVRRLACSVFVTKFRFLFAQQALALMFRDSGSEPPLGRRCVEGTRVNGQAPLPVGSVEDALLLSA